MRSRRTWEVAIVIKYAEMTNKIKNEPQSSNKKSVSRYVNKIMYPILVVFFFLFGFSERVTKETMVFFSLRARSKPNK